MLSTVSGDRATTLILVAGLMFLLAGGAFLLGCPDTAHATSSTPQHDGGPACAPHAGHTAVILVAPQPDRPGTAATAVVRVVAPVLATAWDRPGMVPSSNAPPPVADPLFGRLLI